jgi:uncharacterized protein (DUF983 family)
MAGVNPVLAGLMCRCPDCGRGALFQGFLRVSEACPACGRDLRAADSGDGPAVFVILVVGFIACFGVLFTEVAYHPPVWVHLVVWLPIAGALAVGLMRPFKGVMLAMQFHHRASEAGRRDV